VTKTRKFKIALDLDGVIIDKPPLIPKKLIEWLFKGGRKDGLFYRFPASKFEQAIRKISHFYLFRPPIRESFAFIKEISASKDFDLFIVSGRYSFLKKETENWLKIKNINSFFKKIYLNLNNKQPHLFKEEVLKKLKPDIFIDDDNLLADYLAQKLEGIKVYCCINGSEKCLKAEPISSIKEIPLFK